MIEAFHLAHERIFGYAYRNEQKVEVVNFCLAGFGVIDRPKLPQLKTKIGAANCMPIETRQVYFDGKFTETSIFDRTQFLAEQVINGPSIIEEFGSTTVVFPGQKATIDDLSLIHI